MHTRSQMIEITVYKRASSAYIYLCNSQIRVREIMDDLFGTESDLVWP